MWKSFTHVCILLASDTLEDIIRIVIFVRSITFIDKCVFYWWDTRFLSSWVNPGPHRWGVLKITHMRERIVITFTFLKCVNMNVIDIYYKVITFPTQICVLILTVIQILKRFDRMINDSYTTVPGV